MAVGYRQSSERAEALAAGLAKEFGHPMLAVGGDVADEEDVAEMFRQIRQELGSLRYSLTAPASAGRAYFRT